MKTNCRDKPGMLSSLSAYAPSVHQEQWKSERPSRRLRANGMRLARSIPAGSGSAPREKGNGLLDKTHLPGKV